MKHSWVAQPNCRCRKRHPISSLCCLHAEPELSSNLPLYPQACNWCKLEATEPPPGRSIQTQIISVRFATPDDIKTNISLQPLVHLDALYRGLGCYVRFVDTLRGTNFGLEVPIRRILLSLSRVALAWPCPRAGGCPK